MYPIKLKASHKEDVFFLSSLLYPVVILKDCCFYEDNTLTFYMDRYCIELEGKSSSLKCFSAIVIHNVLKNVPINFKKSVLILNKMEKIANHLYLYFNDSTIKIPIGKDFFVTLDDIGKKRACNKKSKPTAIKNKLN